MVKRDCKLKHGIFFPYDFTQRVIRIFKNQTIKKKEPVFMLVTGRGMY